MIDDTHIEANIEKNLLKRKAIITGASRGIGLCIAKVLAKVGVDLILTDINIGTHSFHCK